LTSIPEITTVQADAIKNAIRGYGEPQTLDAAGLASYATMERLLRRATIPVRSCDWGLLLDEGPNMVLPHVSKIRELARRQLYLAEIDLHENRTQEGVDRLLTVHAMARHTVGIQPLLILVLVGQTIEMEAMQVAARHCQSWDRTTRLAYLGRQRDLPPLPTAAQGVQGEKHLFDYVVKDGRLDQIPVFDKDVRQAWLALSHDPAAMRRSILAFVQSLDCMAKLMALPRAASLEAMQQLKVEAEAAGQSNPLIRLWIPIAANAQDTTYKMRTIENMLLAALEQGSDLDPAKAAAYRDALDGQPLQLVRGADNVLRLVTAGIYPKNPIELLLGHTRVAPMR
jgi:hypothetical protein